ncbi:hypothetical protein D3C81_748620 [compost metagenome]
MPQYRQALLCVGPALLCHIVYQHTPQHALTEPGVVAYLLMKEIGKVAGPDNQCVIQPGVCGKPFLQFTHGNVQEQLNEITNDK